MTPAFDFGRRLTIRELVTWRERGLDALAPEPRELAERRLAYLAYVRNRGCLPETVGSCGPSGVTKFPQGPEGPDTQEKGGSRAVGRLARPGEGSTASAGAACACCRKALAPTPGRGRKARFCCHTCRQAAYRAKERALESAGQPEEAQAPAL